MEYSSAVMMVLQWVVSMGILSVVQMVDLMVACWDYHLAVPMVESMAFLREMLSVVPKVAM